MRKFPAHLGPFKAPKPKVRCIKTAQWTRDEVAKSSPARMRLQWLTGMNVGASNAATGAASASDALGGDAREGDGSAFPSVSVPPIGGAPGGGPGDDAAGDDAAFAFASASASLHFIKDAMVPSFSSSMRSSANGGRAQ
jgi:hypothetical protein